VKNIIKNNPADLDEHLSSSLVHNGIHLPRQQNNQLVQKTSRNTRNGTPLGIFPDNTSSSPEDFSLSFPL